jgi:hypothetical protein
MHCIILRSKKRSNAAAPDRSYESSLEMEFRLRDLARGLSDRDLAVAVAQTEAFLKRNKSRQSPIT